MMKKIFTAITSFVTLIFMILPFNVSAEEYENNFTVDSSSFLTNTAITTGTTTTTTTTTTATTPIETITSTTAETTTSTTSVKQEKTLTGYIDVLYPEQTCLLGKTTYLDSIWLQLMVIDDENNVTILDKFNTGFDNHTCYSIDKSSVDLNTPGTYQYSVKSIAGITETFYVPNDEGGFDYYNIEMIDYEATAELTVSNQTRVLSLDTNELTLEIDNVYFVEFSKYNKDEISFEWTGDEIASVDVYLEGESYVWYLITAKSEGTSTLTFSAIDGQTASINIDVVYEKPTVTTTAKTTITNTTTETTLTNKVTEVTEPTETIDISTATETEVTVTIDTYETETTTTTFTTDATESSDITTEQIVTENPLTTTVSSITTTTTVCETSLNIAFYVKEMPTKTSYKIGEELDLTGLTFDNLLTLTNQNGDSVNFDKFYRPYTDFEIDTSEFNSSVAGTYTIYATSNVDEVGPYGGHYIGSATTSFEVTVVGSNEELPQTGYSNIHKVIAGLATLMTVTGTAFVVNTRKENE